MLQSNSEADAGSEPVIRPVTADDAPRLGALHMACWREAYGELLSAAFFDRATPASSAERWARTIAHLTDTQRLVAGVRNDEFIGFAMSGPARGEDPPRELELYAVYIRASEYATGLGQRLLDAVIADRPAYLWVLERNPRAKAFYERNGFRHDGATEVLDDFENLTEIRLVR